MLLYFNMHFKIIGDITDIQTIAVGGRIRDIMRLRRKYGMAAWKKMKGIANIRIQNGKICRAEIHWYEAHGIGKRKLKIKKILE